MTPEIQKFTGIDNVKWGGIISAVLDKTGIDITADAGEQSAKGITLGWMYSAVLESLTITLKDREFFDPSADKIELAISDLVASA